jgi:hypothetical protein
MTVLKLYTPIYVDEHVMPLIDSMTHARNCRRSDVIREILYPKFNYIPPHKTDAQYKEIYALENISEEPGKNSRRNKCVAIYIDPGFELIILKQKMYELYQSSGIYRILCDRFGIECKWVEYEHFGTPAKGGLRIKKVFSKTSL